VLTSGLSKIEKVH